MYFYHQGISEDHLKYIHWALACKRPDRHEHGTYGLGEGLGGAGVTGS